MEKKGMDIEKLAKLTRISFSKEEQEKLKKDLGKLKDLIDRVKSSDVKTDPLPFEVLRPYKELLENEEKQDKKLRGSDQVSPSLPIEETEKLAPKFSMRHFIIPKVLPK